nr:dynein light chain LC6, flagellar outer arm-like [Ipomoea batatas]
MPMKMQIQAMSCAYQALDLYDVLDCKSIAAHIKKEFDKRYGNGWQCVVGTNFGHWDFCLLSYISIGCEVSGNGTRTILQAEVPAKALCIRP